MASGTNKNFQSIIDRAATTSGNEVATPPRRPTGASVLTGRVTALAGMAAGDRVDRNQEFIDPARCRIWGYHNRIYGDLNEENCADLLESLVAQGKQDIPAIVRRVRGVDGIDYEVICGARRHWSISWLRQHNYPDFKFLIEVRDLQDEEAFRLADLENRNRRDISDYERALDYLKAIDRFYDGNRRRMAERLKVHEAWLSRYLEIAKLPDEVLAAFGSPHLVGIKAASLIAPLLKVDGKREKVLKEAAIITEEQSQLRDSEGRLIEGGVVVHRLVAAASRAMADPTLSARNRSPDVFAKSGKLLMNVKKGRGGALRIDVRSDAEAGRAEVIEAVTKLFDDWPE